MGKVIDLAGQKYGRLTVLERQPNTKTGKAVWRCLCDCGAFTSVQSDKLKSGHTSSCGCLQREVLDLTGIKYGRWTVLSRERSAKHGQSLWKCVCDCGNIKIITGAVIKSGESKSCGCYKNEMASINATIARTKHSHSKRGNVSSVYRIWQAIKSRCTNPSNPAFKDYGGRGITVCNRWAESFENFLEDMGERPEGLSIDRIDNSLGYRKENCRWATPKEQNSNQRSNKWLAWNGSVKILLEWSREWGLKHQTISYLLKKGRSMEWIYINKVEPKLSPSTIQARMMLVV